MELALWYARPSGNPENISPRRTVTSPASGMAWRDRRAARGRNASSTSPILCEYDARAVSCGSCPCGHRNPPYTLSCTHLAHKMPNTGENLAQSGPILTAPRG